MMMTNAVSILLLGLFMSATGHKISSGCVDLCKAADATIKCSSPCELDSGVLSALRSIYGRDVVDGCVAPCRCDEHVYRYVGDKVCEILQSFAVSRDSCRCESTAWSDNLSKWKFQEPAEFARAEVIDYLIELSGAKKSSRSLRPRVEPVTANPWENWCKHQCAEGLGGSACYCDIIP